MFEYVIVATLNFKTCCFAYWGGSPVAVVILSLYLCFSLSLNCSFNLSLCHLLLFLLSSVTVSSHVAFQVIITCDCAMLSLCWPWNDLLITRVLSNSVTWLEHLISVWIEGHGSNSHPELRIFSEFFFPHIQFFLFIIYCSGSIYMTVWCS